MWSDFLNLKTTLSIEIYTLTEQLPIKWDSLAIENIFLTRKYLEILEKFVNFGIDRDAKCLGAYYVLGALTLVSEEAATSLPWLYQAVCYM